MSNSNLVNYVKISPNSNNPRNDKIRKITIHHMAGNLSVETCGNVFAPASRGASSNYGIGTDGRVGMYVEEKNRSWCSSSGENDHQAVTIEVANDESGGNWHVSNKALAKLIELCVDICKRNGIAKLNYTGDKSGNLTRHNMFAATGCPGAYLQSRFSYIAEQVNKGLGSGTEAPKPPQEDGAKLYRVQLGAFHSKANADALVAELKGKGYSSIVTEEDNEPAPPAPTPPAITEGERVRIKAGATKYATGQSIPTWVKAKTYTAAQVEPTKVLLQEITSWVNKNDIEKI